jgi:hypothetical protein
MRRLPSLLTCLLVAVLGVAPVASAATVRGQWGMRAAHGSIAATAGPYNLHLSGAWKDVAGSVGRAVQFWWAGRPAAALTRSRTAFNPARAEFAVGVTLKAHAVPAFGGYSPNVVQKGLFDDRGQWKMELIHKRSGTVARCRFSGTAGHHSVIDRTRTRLNDQRWHNVICWRTTSQLGIRVDGATTHLNGTVGTIANHRPLRVAAKTYTSGITDQFQGDIDCVAYVQGRHSLRLAVAKVPC